MNRIQRCLAALAGLGGALLALAATAPAALAGRIPPWPAPASSPPAALPRHPHLPPGHMLHHIQRPVHLPPAPAPAQVVFTGGMPGWQITLIAAGAALLGAMLAVLLSRAWAARRATTSAT